MNELKDNRINAKERVQLEKNPSNCPIIAKNIKDTVVLIVIGAFGIVPKILESMR